MKPTNNKIQLDVQEITHMGESTGAIQEQGIIIALGDWMDDDKWKIGATLYFKAWAVDIITDGDKKYYFIDALSDAICAIKYEN